MDEPRVNRRPRKVVLGRSIGIVRFVGCVTPCPEAGVRRQGRRILEGGHHTRPTPANAPRPGQYTNVIRRGLSGREARACCESGYPRFRIEHDHRTFPSCPFFHSFADQQPRLLSANSIHKHIRSSFSVFRQDSVTTIVIPEGF